MKNKFPGVCECGKRVAAGAGAVAKVGGKWAVRCASHDIVPAPESRWMTYRDGDRVVIGRKDWQTCYSATYGVTVAYTREEVAAALTWAEGLTDAEAAAAKRYFETPYRFERADRRGMFGAAW